MTDSSPDLFTYDAARNSAASYDIALAALRERLERAKTVIGDCTLYHEDCSFVLPTLWGIDAVVTDPPYGSDIVSRGTRNPSSAISS
jgi:hypothetical protein